MKRLVVVFAFLLAPLAAHAQGVFVSVPGVRVNIAPPAPRVEVIPVRPSPQHTWIAGHWAWRGGGHVWIDGRWAMAPAPGYHWVPARWVNQGGNYVFYEGHWAINQPTQPTYVYDPGPPPVQEVVVQTAPPEPIVEVRPPVPFGGAVWIGGYWQWNGYRHTWVGGHWSAARAGYTWEPHRWVRGPGGWRWAPGHWRR